LIVIVQILVTQRNAEDALANPRADLVFDQFRAAVVGEAGSKPIQQSNRPIRRSQQQRTGVRCYPASIKPCHHRATRNRCKFKQRWVTLWASGNTSASEKVLLAKELSPIRNPNAPTQCEICGLAASTRAALSAASLMSGCAPSRPHRSGLKAAGTPGRHHARPTSRLPSSERTTPYRLLRLAAVYV
jgi:hypothetical protein